MKSKLLFDIPPLVILPELAMKIGLNESIVLQQIHYWLENNKNKKQTANFKEDRWWTYGSYEYWQETNFPFWSVSTVRRTMRSLERLGILISNQFESKDWEHRKWYSIDYEVLDSFVDRVKLTRSKGSKRPNRRGQSESILNESEISRESKSSFPAKKIASHPPAERAYPLPDGL